MRMFTIGILCMPAALFTSASVNASSMTINSNLQSWLNMAAGGNNPIVLRNAQVFSKSIPTYVPPSNLTDPWVYRSEAEKAVPIAFAAADPASSNRGRADLLQGTVDRVDWLAAQYRSDGTLPASDPNINRFALAPILECVLYLEGGIGNWGRRSSLKSPLSEDQ
jgi:hypothetical protein